MFQIQESNGSSLEKKMNTSTILQRFVPILCIASSICYLIFSHGLEFFLSGWNYRIELFKMVFAKGFWQSLPQHVPLFSNVFSWNEGLLLPVCFMLTCLTSAWLLHSLLNCKKDELGPNLVLFSLTSAILPTLLIALFLWPDGKGKLTLELAFFSSLLIAIGLGGVRITSFLRLPFQRKAEPQKNERFGVAWAFILPLIILYAFVYLIGFISIIGYDALAYHLPLSASWLHNGSLLRDANIQSYYPGDPELLLRWVLCIGSEQGIFLISFLSTLFCIYMVYKLGRVIGQGRQAAAIAACCAATIPLLPFLATTAYTDTVGILFLLLSVFFLIKWIQNDLLTSRHLFSAGLAAGLAAGSKINMLTSVLAISIVAIIAVLRSRHIWKKTGPRIEDVGINWPWLFTRSGGFTLAALIGGGYWYLRNLIEKGNPFYPVSVLGLPGLDLKTILPSQPELAANHWKWFLYPWTELGFHSPYDDGIGMMAATIAIPAFFIWPFLRIEEKGVKRTGPGIIFFITCLSLLLFAWSDNMTCRYGIFLFLMCFILIGELWSAVPSRSLRITALLSFIIMTTILIQNLAGGYTYMFLRKNETRAEKLLVPQIVDSLAPTRIFNAAGADHTYGLMGYDYRHEVITLYKSIVPENIMDFKPVYILIRKDDEQIFKAKLHLKSIGEETKGNYPVSLWKIDQDQK
jgi:hypothetical protein